MGNKQKINARIVADSINPQGDRITTFVLTYPRIIHAEVMTHRLFSRNAASSRAIPFKTMVKSVKEDPFIPIAWQKDHKGMQGTEYWTKEDILTPIPDKTFEIDALTHYRNEWLAFRDNACYDATEMHETLGITKQLCNRLLEPFQWYTCLVTVTELENFYELRCPKYTNGYEETFRSRKDYINGTLEPEMYPKSEEGWWMISQSGAEIHIQALAEAMWDAQNESTPNKLEAGEWHIPFGNRIFSEDKIEDFLRTQNVQWVTAEGHDEELEKIALKIATARAARLSYMTFDGEIDYAKDIALHDSLLASKHASAFEHCCKVLNEEEYNTLGKMTPHPEKGYVFEKGWVDNIRGFISYRRILNI